MPVFTAQQMWQHVAQFISNHRNLLLQPFYGPLSGTTQVSRYQKYKQFGILLKQRRWGGSGISWTICKLFAPRSRQITMPTPHHSSFKLLMGQMFFLPPNQQHQSTEGQQSQQLSMQLIQLNSSCLVPLVNTVLQYFYSNVHNIIRHKIHRLQVQSEQDMWCSDISHLQQLPCWHRFIYVDDKKQTN